MSDSPKQRKKVKKSTVSAPRHEPNILITGTPGVGKSTLCKMLAQRVESLTWINIGDFAKANDALGEWDEEFSCHVLDEDKVVDELEDAMAKGGVVIDHHVTDFFPERWFDIVFVLRTENSVLYDRLSGGRGYTGKKLENNMDSEIFQTILDEAKESYKEEIVHELQSNEDKDVESNAERIVAWIGQWKIDNASAAE